MVEPASAGKTAEYYGTAERRRDHPGDARPVSLRTVNDFGATTKHAFVQLHDVMRNQLRRDITPA